GTWAQWGQAGDQRRAWWSESGHQPAGASWQRSRVHFMWDALGVLPKRAQQMVAATIRTVFAQPDPAAARGQWRRVADTFRARYSRVAEMLDAAEADVLAYLAFPSGHWRRVWSNNPQEMASSQLTIAA
ncbi:MAG: transposase, partial [Chloroflexi bacterium]|nr:transposase [Chloroflexota bacterium]